jgi:hypothetical protein
MQMVPGEARSYDYYEVCLYLPFKIIELKIQKHPNIDVDMLCTIRSAKLSISQQMIRQ